MTALAVAHCGGQSVQHGTDGAGESGASATGGTTSGASPGGTGGTGGTAGTAGGDPRGGTSGTGEPAGDCYYRGEWFDQGEQLVPQDDPCTFCICNNVSRVVCGDRDCTSCTYEGQTHPINEGFPAKDGCNTCSCNERGDVTCSHQACETDPLCVDLGAKFALELSAQQACPAQDPRPEGTCVFTAFDSLPCGCNTAVRDASTLEAIANEYFALGCGQDPVCPPCYDIGDAAFCYDGTCVLGGYI